ncbi:MAG: hypothetical protein Q4E55_01865 [Bacteroidales bacterium]|nr:hypothetical protein [Bacteroidales bacterium]
MRHIGLLLSLVLVGTFASGQEASNTESLCVRIMERISPRPAQGMEVFGKWMFNLEHGGGVNVYNLRTKKFVARFKLASAGEENHANCANFGIETAEGASFPLLYVSNGLTGCDSEWTCNVESIIRKGRTFTSVLSQKITLDISDWPEAGLTTIWGAPSWLIDRERRCLWIFSARKRTKYPYTKEKSENQYVATAFRIPALAEGKEVTLTAKDVVRQVLFPYDVWFTQSGCVEDGKIYYCFGVYKKKDNEYPPAIRVYDTDNASIVARLDLTDHLFCEPEALVVRKGSILLNGNGSSHKAYVYEVKLP